MKYSNFKIFPDLNLIIEAFIGETTIDAFIKHKEKLIRDDLFNSNYRFITDFRNTTLKVLLEQDISTYISFVKEIFRIDYKSNTAILTATPHQVVVSTLYSIDNQNNFDNACIFSTLEAGIKYLSIEENHRYLIETTLEIMKEEFYR